ncbi:MAG: CHAD domain-containing protein, partial [Leptolyngbyaceae cyanobacterium T60_A2020_046]|nr:CHAD domain-containing protein [Leptolyngbyaceae cyanobacterium T60_A2020_046]
MTAVSQAMGLQANQAICKYLQRAERYEKRVLEDKDPEDLHQMRVALRRLRTVMQVFAGGIQLPKAANDRRVAQVSRC